MDLGAAIQLTLAIMGGALIGGGIVAYRGSPRGMARSFAMAAVSAGAIMLMVVGITVPVTSTGEPSDPVIEVVEAPAQMEWQSS